MNVWKCYERRVIKIILYSINRVTQIKILLLNAPSQSNEFYFSLYYLFYFYVGPTDSNTIKF